jgi:hypothetical protein
MKIQILFILLISTASVSANESKEKIIYKYKEYEKFDLGDLEIKGSIVAPGDLSVKERRHKTFGRKLYQRNDFDQNIIKDIKFIR